MQERERFKFAVIAEDSSGKWHINYCLGSPYICKTSNMTFGDPNKAVQVVKRQAPEFTPIIRNKKYVV